MKSADGLNEYSKEIFGLAESGEGRNLLVKRNNKKRALKE